MEETVEEIVEEIVEPIVEEIMWRWRGHNSPPGGPAPCRRAAWGAANCVESTAVGNYNSGNPL